MSPSLDVQPDNLPLPTPKIRLQEIADGKPLRIVVIGVGGSGVTTIGRVIAQAASSMGGREDIDFKFVDQKGLAQRNGSVTSHLSFFPQGQGHGQTVGLGQADLVLSPDLIEGARALKYLRPNGSMIIDDEAQIPLSVLMQEVSAEDPFDQNQLRNQLEKVLQDQCLHYPFKAESFRRYGKSVYAASMLLGVVFQKGFLPFSLKDLEGAFHSSLPSSELANNLSAFELGRQLFLEHPAQAGQTPKEEGLYTLEDYILSVQESIPWWKNSKAIMQNFNNSYQQVQAIDSFSALEWSALLHDLWVFDHGQKFQEFLVDTKKIIQEYTEKTEQKIALRTLARTYWIKDEVFVSHLMTCHLKLKKDEKEFKNLGSSFKTRYINRPHFDFGLFTWEFDFSPRPWMLKIMRQARILRILMPRWHRKEKLIALRIRKALLAEVPRRLGRDRQKYLREIESIKGYREIRYTKAKRVFQDIQL